jgi:3-hydroxyisobutyrate dehydrogenase-like beta-hydroxyacid dehydrogenase
MGSALARALLKAGNRVTVWNRTPEKAEALAAEGALVAGTAANALAASDVSIACVTDHAATMEILSGVRTGGSDYDAPSRELAVQRTLDWFARWR